MARGPQICFLSIFACLASQAVQCIKCLILLLPPHSSCSDLSAMPAFNWTQVGDNYPIHASYCFSSPQMFGLLLRSLTPSLPVLPMSSRQMRWDSNPLSRLGSCHTVDWTMNTCQLARIYLLLYFYIHYISTQLHKQAECPTGVIPCQDDCEVPPE